SLRPPLLVTCRSTAAEATVSAGRNHHQVAPDASSAAAAPIAAAHRLRRRRGGGATRSRSARAEASSSLTSPMDCQRSLRFLHRQVSTMRSSAGGNAGENWRAGGGSLEITAASVARSVSSWKARRGRQHLVEHAAEGKDI